MTPAVVLGLQQSAGNRAVQRLVPRPVTVQRDITPGQPLPDAASIGKQRLEDRKQSERGDLNKQGYLAELAKTADDDTLVTKLIDDRRVDMGQFFRQMAQKRYPTDPDRVEQEVKAKLDPLIPDEFDVVLARLELLSYGLDADDPSKKTSEWARGYIDRSTLSESQKWLAKALIESAAMTNAEAVRRKLRLDAEAEWQQIWTRPEGASFGQAMTKQERTSFAAALKAMAPLVAIGGSHRGEADKLAVGPGASMWKDGGWLSDDIAEVNQDDNKKPIATKDLHRGPIDNGTFANDVRAADRMIRQFVQKNILAGINRPKIKVHPMKESRFRAFQNGGEVHLAANEPVSIMVHEVGHYLEAQGSIATWADIQKLMMKRHEVGGGGTTTSEGAMGMRKEGRYKGEYPVTGKYTSKAYSTGDTEVMSMTLEYLANPKRFSDMVEKDPVQVAVVIRGLQPDLYAAQGSLRAYDKFLPS